MEKYITFRECENDKLQYYILQRDFPHFMGKIENFPHVVFVPAAPIAGYNMWVTFSYALRGKYIPSYKNVLEEMSIVLEDMAAWFRSERINKEEKRYSKFKIKNENAAIPNQ